ARVLRRRSDREEACDQRSAPQDVTSSWVRRGGVNLKPEVVPQQTERPPRDSPTEDTPDTTVGVEMNIQVDRRGITGFRGSKALQPRRLLSLGVRPAEDRTCSRELLSALTFRLRLCPNLPRRAMRLCGT